MFSQAISRADYGKGPLTPLSRRYLHHGVPDSPWLRARDRSAEGKA